MCIDAQICLLKLNEFEMIMRLIKADRQKTLGYNNILSMVAILMKILKQTDEVLTFMV